MLLDEVSASKLIAVDREGMRVSDSTPEPDSGALALVLAALEARPNAVAAAQVTTAASCAVASLENGLAPISQTAFMFHGAIGTHHWRPTNDAKTLREQITHEMAECPTQLVHGRGLLVTGTTLAQTWKFVFFLDKCCRSQVSAMATSAATGNALTVPSDEVIERTITQSRAFIEHARFVADWPNFLQQLDREDPSFRE
jgi:ribulose-5-phosphate 4-epimerase/fuculose-1-phosphate aldolase